MILKHTLDFIFKGITVLLYYHMLSLAVNAKDSITKAKSYQHEQPQKRSNCRTQIKNTTKSSKQSLPFAQSYLRQVWFMPEGLGFFNKIRTGGRGKEVKSLLSYLRPRFCNYSRGAAIN